MGILIKATMGLMLLTILSADALAVCSEELSGPQTTSIGGYFRQAATIEFVVWGWSYCAPCPDCVLNISLYDSMGDVNNPIIENQPMTRLDTVYFGYPVKASDVEAGKSYTVYVSRYDPYYDVWDALYYRADISAEEVTGSCGVSDLSTCFRNLGTWLTDMKNGILGLPGTLISLIWDKVFVETGIWGAISPSWESLKWGLSFNFKALGVIKNMILHPLDSSWNFIKYVAASLVSVFLILGALVMVPLTIFLGTIEFIFLCHAIIVNGSRLNLYNFISSMLKSHVYVLSGVAGFIMTLRNIKTGTVGDAI